jgi:serine/arginine repetitive matrix protein 2
MPRGPGRGPSPSPVYYPGPRPDMPPLPHGYQHHIAVEQARLLNRSIKGSVSSGSTNVRTDSDAPSSDMASPPTPKDGASMEVLISPDGTRFVDTAASMVKDDNSDGPMYYDYTEQFDRGPVTEPEANAIPTGFDNRIKPIIEERRTAETSLKGKDAPGNKMSVEVVQSEVPGIVELPASPVARRITRELIRQALEPASTTDYVISSEQSTNSRREPENEHSNVHAVAARRPSRDDVVQTSLHPAERRENRHSILSQTGSSVLDSSTLDFAVRYSIPMASGAGFQPDMAADSGSEPASPASPGRSTEDGMSELLAGYQHTDSQQEVGRTSKDDMTPKKERLSADQVEKRSNHGQKSSDEQSFKSCTDLPEVVSASPSPTPDKGQDQEAKSFKSATDSLPQREPSVKQSDAHSFQTAKDAITPDRGWSMPPSRLPSSSLANELGHHKSSLSEVNLPSPPPAVLRKPVPPRESSFSIMASKLRASSKPSIKQGSMSMSGSSSTLSATQQPPVVPRRESSSSKEAQRYQAVASFLMRQLPARMSKTKKAIIEEESSTSKAEDHPVNGSVLNDGDRGEPSSASTLPSDVNKSPEKVLTKQVVEPERRIAASLPFKNPSSSKVLEIGDSPASHHHSFSTPTPALPEPSSVYSPQDVSSRSRVYSSPVSISRSPEHSQRDSQTTTHLAWPGGRSFSIPTTTAIERHLPLPNIQENTTTDLRLSQYRYAGPPHYLPDLKEESHEDSSLNTSASNLKHSSFRFPIGPPGVRASVDDAIVLLGRSSMGSQRRSAAGLALGQTQGLPSMQFSQMNLVEKLHEELGLRYSRSLEDVAKGPKELSGESPPRPASAGEVRETYRSLIAEMERIERPRESTALTKSNVVSSKRTGSSERLIAELDQLTIPSVGGLTERISELFPSLKEYYKLEDQGEFPEEEEIMEHALEEIHEVHPTQKRSSARLRPLPGSPNMVVVKDDVYNELTGKDKENDSPGRQGDCDAKVSAGEVGSSAKETGKTVTHPPTRQLTPLAELEAPPPAVLRPRALTAGHQDFRASGESALSSRRSLRSFVSTPTATETRPWNSDKNYPWATTTIPSVDISLPPRTAVRHSPRPGPSHLRNRLSDATITSTSSSAQTATESPFGSAPGSNGHARRHRFSTLGRNGDQPHAVGERYPTSALTPPTAIFRDHLTTSDTSDDEEFNTSRKPKLGLRKRFSSARNATVDNNTRATRSKTTAQELASPESTKQSTTSVLQDRAGEAQAFTSHRHTFRDAEGMRPADYHRHRILERLKRWWDKGDRLIRSLSRRNRHDTTIT